jgi:SPASM domain peptide maturase of grasp-with-spasm system
MNSNSHLKLFANCTAVSGYTRGIIMDLQRNCYYTIPLDMITILEKANLNSYSAMCKQYEKKSLDEYFEFLLNRDLAFFVKKKDIKCFPELNKQWDYPSKISNLNFEYNSNVVIKPYLKDVLLDNHIYNVSINFLPACKETDIIELLNIFLGMPVFHIELNLFNNEMFTENILSICSTRCNIKGVKIFSCNEMKFKKSQNFTITKLTNSISSCGFINAAVMVCSIPYYTESILHNSCLNRKVCIDANGEIKNCPSMSKSYGNIKDTSLAEAIEKPGFKDLWFINKDKIDVCKDCEFRHMCTDCRAFIKDQNNIYSQPAKCPYNPYIAKWEGEEGYVPVEECGSYSQETGFIVNKQKINNLNKQICSE